MESQDIPKLCKRKELMPTLQFKGRNVIWNHHLSVPYHTLDEVKELAVNLKKLNGNLLIEGDNLIALKALLPFYAGNIDCIYIDPPYNTGEEKWVYNDNVNSPMMREWIGKVVGKDDLTRHDKWLCMIVSRLRILRELLSDSGVIFISIENNEIANLKSIMDEVFVEGNFVGVLVWRKKEGGGQTDQYFVTEHEYIIAYRKTDKFQWLDEKVEIDDKSYKHEDKDGKYTLVKLAKWGNAARKEDREKMHFPIYTPNEKKVIPMAPDGSLGRWRVGKKRMTELIDYGLVHFEKKNGEWIAYEKIYYEEGEVKVIKERSILYEIASTGDGTKELTNLFGKKDVFSNPKPVDVIKWLLQYSTFSNSIILDSFAGSGTTAHAIMDLNKEDRGNRKFILVQMTEATPEEPNKNICKDITRERMKRAIEKYGYDTGFKYLRVGIPLDAESMLSGNLPTYKQFAKYVYYLCTGKNLPNEEKIKESEYFVGEFGSIAIHLIYKQDFKQLTRLALNLEWAEKFCKARQKKKLVVYAPSCFLSEEDLEEMQIDFVSIPYNLFQRNG